MELLKTYTSAQFAKRIGISTPTLQKWEEHFKDLSPSLDAQGKRYYTDSDADVWELIVRWIKTEKCDLEEAARRVSLQQEFRRRQHESIQRLTNIRQFLQHLADDLP